MNGAKIHLSTQEMELVTNKEWLFLKRSILTKVEDLFGGLQSGFRNRLEKENFIFNNSLKNHGGKISRGENYKGLPYRILDYPAMFSKEHIFAIRTLFWWGNFFSISLHLSGKYLSLNRNPTGSFSYLREHNFRIHSGKDEWDHDLDEPGYLATGELKFEEFQEILQHKYFKISQKINLNEFDKAPDLLEEAFGEIMDYLKISCRQSGETNLSPVIPTTGFDL